MRALFHLVYRYIFCLPSRHLMQIIMPELDIIYSFWLLWCSFNVNKMFIRSLLCVFFYVSFPTTCTWFFFFFGMHIASLFFVYWHVSHSFVSSTVTPFESQLHIWHGHIPSISEWFTTEQWQRQLQLLHLVSAIKVFPEPFFKFFPPFIHFLPPILFVDPYLLLKVRM